MTTQHVDLWCDECRELKTKIFEDSRIESRMCRCERANPARLPPELRPAVPSDEHRRSPLMAKFATSLVCRASWTEVRCVLRAGIEDGLLADALITSDMQLKNVGYGDLRRERKSDGSVTDGYNTIEELVVPPPLLVVECGLILSSPPRAEPAEKFAEAVFARIRSGRPIWIVTPHGVTFSEGHLPIIWSQAVEDAISGFERLDGVKTAHVPLAMRPKPPPPRNVISLEDRYGVGIKKSKRTTKKRRDD